MDPVAFDFETCCFRPGLMAPPPVCASTYHPQDGTRLWSTEQLPEVCERIASEPAPILWHGGAYDACVWLEWMPKPVRELLWEKYENDQIIDTITTEKIIEIGSGVRGKLALDELARRYGIDVRKSCVRTDFGRYLGAPLSEYTAEHKRYVSGDAAELYTLHKRQWNRGLVSRKDLADLVRGDLWLRLSSNYGIRTDPARVGELERTTQEDVEELTIIAQAEGLMAARMTAEQIREGGWYSRDQKAIKRLVREAYEGNPPRTDSWTDGLDRKGNQTDPRGIPGSEEFDEYWAVSLASTTLEESGNPLLEAVAHLGQLLKVRSNDVKMLKAGVFEPIHTRYGYAATTRTTSSKPNVQNPRKKRGIRECFTPREGCCFVDTDYPSLELFAMAQVCAWKLGRYDLVRNMNAGRDYHAVIAAGILGTTYEDIMARKGTDPAVKNARDCGKYGNYGLMGYMTDPHTFALYVNMGSRTDENPRGLRWSDAQAAEVMAQWRKNAVDPVAFLRHVDTLRNRIGLYDVEIPGTTIIRRGCTRTAAANTLGLQGLGATIARRAGWRIARRQYRYGTLPASTVIFCHDSFLAECKIEDRDAVAAGQEEEMAAALHEVCPDMEIWPDSRGKPPRPMTVIDSAAQDHYSKHAKSKRDSAGRLIVCRM